MTVKIKQDHKTTRQKATKTEIKTKIKTKIQRNYAGTIF
jgi:hypothetical protein